MHQLKPSVKQKHMRTHAHAHTHTHTYVHTHNTHTHTQTHATRARRQGGQYNLHAMLGCMPTPREAGNRGYNGVRLDRDTGRWQVRCAVRPILPGAEAAVLVVVVVLYLVLCG